MKTYRFTLIELMVVVAILVIILGMGLGVCKGCSGSGVINDLTVTVTDKHVDKGDYESCYMVMTDKGCFEINNGIFLGVWNCDELFGRMQKDKTYKIRTKGIRRVSFFSQIYPYIISVEGPIETDVTKGEKP